MDWCMGRSSERIKLFNCGVCMIAKNKIWEHPVELVSPLEIKTKTSSSEELNKRIESVNKDAAKTAKLEN